MGSDRNAKGKSSGAESLPALGRGCFSAEVLGSLQMAQEGARKGASRAGPLSELILLGPVPWDPELCVKAGLLVMGVTEVISRRGHKPPRSQARG